MNTSKDSQDAALAKWRSENPQFAKADDLKESEEYNLARWFVLGPPKEISPSTRQILEEYSGVPADEVESHVVAIRQEAWSHFPYPCIGTYRFLDLSLGKHTLYPQVLSRLRDQQQVLLDLGCAFGQDLRRLRADGVPGAQLYGSDLRLEFLELGYKLFRDKDKLGATFIEADVFEPNSGLKALEGRVDVINASSFFHLFDYQQQKTVAQTCLRLLKAQQGSLILGRQVGDTVPGEKDKRMGNGTHFRHDMTSWRKMWEEVGEEAGGIRFEVEGFLKQRSGGEKGVEEQVAMGPSMEFSVKRI